MNADLRIAEVRQFSERDEAWQNIIRVGLSSYPKICAHDRGFGGEEIIQSAHLAEVFQYRPKEMMVR